MELVRPTTFDDVIALFLRTEIASPRWSERILTQLERDGVTRVIVDRPNRASADDNAYRRTLLASYRAYVLDELPDDTAWYRARLSRDELAAVRYIRYDYWDELSNHTRLPAVAAETIRAGRDIFEVPSKRFLDVAQALRDGAVFPELILVAEAPDAPLTVYEGHLRLTAYALAPECIPESLDVVVGFAPECADI